jgi:hypothetical protein
MNELKITGIKMSSPAPSKKEAPVQLSNKKK